MGFHGAVLSPEIVLTVWIKMVHSGASCTLFLMCYAYATYTRLGIVRYMLWSCVCLYVCLSQGHKAVFLSMQLNVSSRIYRLYCRGKESPAISHHCTYNQCVYRCRNIEGTPPQLFSCRFCVDCMSGSRGQ